MHDAKVGTGRGRIAPLAMGAIALLLLTGCVFRDVREQQAKIDVFCFIGGTVATEQESTRPIVVGLVRHTGGAVEEVRNWVLADHFVLESAGRWMFRTSPGTYGLVAYVDSNADGLYQPGEPLLAVDTQRLLSCKSGERKTDVALVVPTRGRSRVEGTIDFMAFQARTAIEQMQASLGLLTAYGEIVTLDDPRFSEERAAASLWRPYDFMFEAHPGVYFLQAYDAAKTPLLFVHGINGTPVDFRYLIEHLDRKKYQPWLYYYPSGAHLGNVADHLDQTIKQLQLQHGFTRYHLVAHSVGGLVSRGFVLRNQTGQSRARIPVVITISTPWAGHKAAESGVKYAPAVVRVWEDMVPNSAYLDDLFFATRAGTKEHRPLPPGVAHHLLFGFKRSGTAMGACTDDTVTVESQLHADAQVDATRIYGFHETHTGILASAATSRLVNRLLDEADR